MSTLKKYSNKTKAAFVLVIIMLIILLSNFNTLQNSKKTNEDINTIYKDRLVVANYIFQYANELHAIKANAKLTQLGDAEKNELIQNSLENIENIDILYLKTVLTAKEKISFDALLATCISIKKESENKNWEQISDSSNQALQMLEQLSQIQIEEGKSKLAHANKLHKGNTILGELQIAILVILGGLSLYLLMAKKNKIKINIPESPGLN